MYDPKKTRVFNDQETKHLAQLLSAVSPLLLTLWVDWVIPLENAAEVERMQLNHLKAARQKMTGVFLYSEPITTERFWFWCKSLTSTVSPYKVVKGGSQKELLFKESSKLLSIGLSFMQFIAISSEILGVDLQNIEPSQYFLIFISALASISLTFGAKEAVSRWVKARGVLNERVPVFITLIKGDGLAWCCLAMVVGEAGFAAPGLLSLLSPRLASQLTYQVSAFLTAGLAALVNVAFAYASALYELKHLSQIVALEPDKRSSSVESLEIQPWVVKRVGVSYNREVREQELVVRRAEMIAQTARERWIKQVRRCMRSPVAMDYLERRRQQGYEEEGVREVWQKR